MSSLRRVALLSIPPLLLIAIGAVFFPSGGRDDAHIGYWVALNLSRLGRIINYNGEAIEQSSTLLHALVLAAAHSLTGANVVLLGRWSAILFGVAAVVLVQVFAARIDRKLAFPAGLLTASSAYFAYWSFGGLEATLCALVALWLILLIGRYATQTNERLINPRLIWITLATLAFLIVRPEQPFVLFCMLAGALGLALLRRDFAASRILIVGLVALVLTAAILIWRYQTFGSLFPQPVNAKSGHLTFDTVKAGLRYYRKHILLHPGALIFTIAVVFGAIGAKRERNPHLLLGLLFLVSYGAFVLFAGGDWMEAGRFFVPLLPIAALLAAFGLSRLSQRPALIFTVALGLGQLVAIYKLAARDSMAIPSWSSVTVEPYAMAARVPGFTGFERSNRANVRDIPTVQRLKELVRQLRAAKSDHEPLRMMSAQLGMVAYHVVGENFGRVEILDRRGLVDRRFTSCPALAHLERSAGGLQLDYDYYFAHRDELERDCHLPRPEIIFDIGEAPAMPDYTVVYTQAGTIRTDSKWLPGKSFPANQFIAVRNDLLGALSR